MRIEQWLWGDWAKETRHWRNRWVIKSTAGTKKHGIYIYIYIYIHVSLKIMPYALVIRDLCNFSNVLIFLSFHLSLNLKVGIDLKFPFVATRFVYSRTSSGKFFRHLASGGPKSHTTNTHKIALTWEQLVNNTKIIHRQQDFNRLQIMEALTIQQQLPSINN